MVEQLLVRYEEIAEEMRKTDETENADGGLEVTGQRYLEHQLAWFGQKYDVENDITLFGKGTAEKELITFLESYAASGKKMFSSNDDGTNEQEEFSKKFTNLANAAYGPHGPNKDRDYKLTVMNNIIKTHNLNYEVKSDRSKDSAKKTYWIVVKLNTERDESKSQ
jgi:hypothetical protein